MALTRHGVGPGTAGAARSRQATATWASGSDSVTLPGSRRTHARLGGGHRPAPELVRRRILALLILVGLAGGTLALRLLYWQVGQHASLSAMALAQYEKVVTLPAERGSILDRNGLPLALNTRVYSIFALPDQIRPSERDHLAMTLAPLLGVEPQALVDRLSDPRRKFVYLKRRVSHEVASRLQGLELAGIGEAPEIQRSYLDGGAPGTTLASNVLGFVNQDEAGQYGVEGFYQRQLGGRAGRESSFRDLANHVIVVGDTRRSEPVNGNQLTLTLDSAIQFATEKALAQGVKNVQAESGTAIVMDPSTGGIVALADYPSFDANHFGTADGRNFLDPAISATYEPGSVMKVMTLAGALQAGAITPTGRIMENGSINVGGFTIRNWDLKAHGDVSWTQVLEKSLNVGAIIAEQREGGNQFYRTLQAFGYGQATGVDLSGEVAPTIPPLPDLRDSQLATMSYGQGISVTPLQVAAAVNAVANGGVWIQPHVVSHQLTPDGDVIEFAPRQHRVLESAYQAQIRQMMVSVVENGSGALAKIPGFSNQIAGKTGTASVPDPERGGYSEQVIGSFAGFMPADEPRFSMLVVVRKPRILFEGAYVAAPVWKEIAQQLVVQWKIAPR